MTEVTVRELKAHLSDYLRRAEAGEQVAVTRRGKRIAVLAPDQSPMSRDEKLKELERRGFITAGGSGKFRLPKPIRLRGDGPTLSEMIVRDRR